MIDCDKYKVKASIGAVLAIIALFFMLMTRSEYVKGSAFLVLLAILGIVLLIAAYLLAIPYIKCLDSNSKMGKPKF